MEPHCIQGGKGQAHKNLDAGFQVAKGLLEGLHLLQVIPLNRRRFGHGPMRRDRLIWPNRTGVSRRLITDGENNIHTRGIGLGKFLPTLTA